MMDAEEQNTPLNTAKLRSITLINVISCNFKIAKL